MPNMNHTGPEGKGPKTGRKLGKCHKSESELKATGELGKGQAKRRNSGLGIGQGKRLKYNQNNNEKL
jgi:hypothetical protein